MPLALFLATLWKIVLLRGIFRIYSSAGIGGEAMPESFLVHDAGVGGPATHALVIGVGAYPHLNGGSGRLSPQHDGMEQLTSPPISARQFASWLMSEFNHPQKPL